MVRNAQYEIAHDGHAPRPNIFAKLARWSFRNASFVLLLWIVAAAIGFGIYLSNPQNLTQPNPVYSTNNDHANRLQEFAKAFPEHERLITLSVVAQSAAARAKVVSAIIAETEQRTDIFDLVFVPGNGAFYEKYGLLYLPEVEVSARIADLRAQAPLFRALAAAPNIDGLTLLVNEVKASIQSNRQPQGLERLFSEAAITVRSVLEGESIALDWRRVAHINVENNSKSAIIISVPKRGFETAARDALEKLKTALQRESKATITITAPPKSKPNPPPTKQNPLPLVSLAAIFMFILSFILLGETRLLFMVLLPPTITSAIIAGAASVLTPKGNEALAIIIMASLLYGLVVAFRYAISLVQHGQVSARWETVAMIAGQKQGPGLVILASALIVFWGILLASGMIGGNNFALILLAVMLALVLPLMMVPALSRFFVGHDEWRYQQESAQFNESLRLHPVRGSMAIVLCGGLAAGFLWPAQTVPGDDGSPIETNQPLQFLLNSEAEARSVIAQLSETEGVVSARWLGAFLPSNAERKDKLLDQLQDLLPRASFSVAVGLEEVNTERIANLEDSLLAITDDKNTSESLRIAAHQFRRSISLLAATGKNIDFATVQLENLLFARFDELATTVNQFAERKTPNLQDVDKPLQVLFQSAAGQYRIEVETDPKISQLQLCKTMIANGLSPISVALAKDAELNVGLEDMKRALGLALFISSLVLLLLSRRRFLWLVGIGAGGVAISVLWLSYPALVNVFDVPSQLALGVMTSMVVAQVAARQLANPISQVGPYSALTRVEPLLCVVFMGSLVAANAVFAAEFNAANLLFAQIVLANLAFIIVFSPLKYALNRLAKAFGALR